VSVPTELSACAEPCTTRRTALALGAAAGAAALLTSCTVYGADSEGGSDADAADAPAGDQAAGTATAGSGSGVAALAKTADIPVGGGKIFTKQRVVVTQPKAGTFKAFSTICTHAGCAVKTIEDGTINCPCHGSKFKIEDGSVADGPATKPLAAKAIKVDGKSITLSA
jgi:Rieske Fe-S protein